VSIVPMELTLINGETCIIDEEDYERVKTYKWTKNTNGYAISYTGTGHQKSKGNPVFIHRILMNLPSSKEDKRVVDHKNGNKLDNRKENLEIVSQMINSQNYRRHNGKRGCIYTRNYTAYPIVAEVSIHKKRYRNYFLEREDAQAWIDQKIEEKKYETLTNVKSSDSCDYSPEGTF